MQYFTSEMCRLCTQESVLHVAFIHPRVSMGTSPMMLLVIDIWTGIPSRQGGGGGGNTLRTEKLHETNCISLCVCVS